MSASLVGSEMCIRDSSILSILHLHLLLLLSLVLCSAPDAPSPPPPYPYPCRPVVSRAPGALRGHDWVVTLPESRDARPLA
eukprot:5195101-Alexandrium_andersonii.AAC.1